MLIRKKYSRGVSIVEVLVALVIIGVGMLGIAGLYVASLQASRSANLRTQAVNFTSDIADRIRANRFAAVAYDTDAYGGAPEEKGCDADTPCTAAELAEDDLAAWLVNLRMALPGGEDIVSGDIVFTDGGANADNYVIVVTWREAGKADGDPNDEYRLAMDM